MITEYPNLGCFTCACACACAYSSAKGLVLRFEFVRRALPLECSFGAVRGAFLDMSSNGLGLGECVLILILPLFLLPRTLELAGGCFELLSNKESKGFGDVRGGALPLPLRSRAFLEDEMELLLLLLLLLLDDELLLLLVAVAVAAVAVVEEEVDDRKGAMLTASDLGDESHRRSQVDSIVDDIVLQTTAQKRVL